MPRVSDSVSLMRRSEQPQPALGKAIRQLRQKHGLTQEQLAQEAGITTGTLSLIERGQANPTWCTVSHICSAVGATFAALGTLVDGLEASRKRPRG